VLFNAVTVPLRVISTVVPFPETCFPLMFRNGPSTGRTQGYEPDPTHLKLPVPLGNNLLPGTNDLSPFWNDPKYAFTP